MEFEHALSELLIGDDAAISGERKRARETGLNVYFSAVDATQEGTNDWGLIFRASQIVIKDVRHDRGVNVTRQILDVDSEVEIR